MKRRDIVKAFVASSIAALCAPAQARPVPHALSQCGRPKARPKAKAKAPQRPMTISRPMISQDPVENLKIATDFLATHKSEPGVVTTESGLQYRVTRAGAASGQRPSIENVVEVNYEGRLLSDQVFDSSYARGQAAQFPVGALIPGWVEALQLMRPGDEWTIWVPPALGYGARSVGPYILPNSLLIFRMKLERIVG
jgi:FKBP-type peptidyl-prolyl cis-trans isomerase